MLCGGDTDVSALRAMVLQSEIYMKKLYFIIPVYKVENYLERCVESVLAQSYNDVEIVLIDDGSPDRCPEMCDKYAEMHDNVHVIHNANGGLSDARNAGLGDIPESIKTDDYITFLDSADFVHPLYAEKMVALCEDNGCNMAQCAYEKGSADVFSETGVKANITVTDSESNTYILETDKANTILRSSLLYMPARNLSNDDYYDDTDIEPSVPVESIKLNQSSLVLKEAFSYKLLATIIPSDATNQNIAWSSSNSSIVTVDNNGIITTLSAGTVNITAEITGMIATCKVKVIPLTTRVMIDYVENGVNYGKGIAIGDIIWAPVNCDFLPDSYSTSKFFQWGRKFGQISWKEDLEFIEGPISLANAQRDIYKDIVFVDTSSPYDWISEYNDLLWNRGTDQTPLKSEYDPCPDGWRVPTHNELSNLKINYGNIHSNKGTDFSGEYTYLDGAPMICLPITGYRDHLGNEYTYNVSDGGEYWSSYTKEGGAYFLYFKGRDIKIKTGSRCDGRCIRCVQE